MQASHLRQSVDEFPREAIAEIFITRVGTQIREGEDGNRRRSWFLRLRGAGRIAGMEHRSVRASGEFDKDRVSASFQLVVGFELGTQAPRFDADERIDAGIEGRIAIEDLDANGVFLEPIARVFYGMFNRVSKKTAHAFGAREEPAGGDPFDARAYFGRRDFALQANLPTGNNSA